MSAIEQEKLGVVVVTSSGHQRRQPEVAFDERT
jgi:hypothetical protein